MASSNYQLFYFLNGKKINDSKRIELLLKTVGISSDLGTTVLTISESSGKFAFGNKVLGGIANGTASGEALSYSQRGANNGIAGLDSGGKVPVTQLPNSIMQYKSLWNVDTNEPALADGVGNDDEKIGDVYKVSVGGTRNLGSGNLTFVVGDYAILNDSKIWELSHSGADAVISVNGQSSVVVLDTDDVSDTSATNKYFTASAAKAAAVGDVITNGVTDVAPSQNAVFDALALKADAGSIGNSQFFTPTNKEAVDALVVRDFVKMLVAGQVTKLLSTDSVGEESFFGCVKVGGAKDATVDVYIPEVGARISGFSGLDVTKLLYASAVDGGGYTQLRPTAGKVIILGKAVSATEIIFMGRFDSEYDAAVVMLVEGGVPGTTSFSETVDGGSPSSTSFETTLDGGTP